MYSRVNAAMRPSQAGQTPVAVTLASYLVWLLLGRLTVAAKRRVHGHVIPVGRQDRWCTGQGSHSSVYSELHVGCGGRSTQASLLHLNGQALLPDGWCTCWDCHAGGAGRGLHQTVPGQVSSDWLSQIHYRTTLTIYSGRTTMINSVPPARGY